jgi:HPt (histidine-containing phosphotransfer) domain-containing protein
MTQIAEQYQHINLAYLTEIADGDMSFVEETINTYLQTIPSEIVQLKDVLQANNCHQASFHAHTLKGAFNFVGATSVAGMCSYIEDACHAKQTNKDIISTLNTIETEAISVSNELKSALSEFVRK